MIVYVIALLIGVLILGAGIYYFVKEKADPESRNIYGITIAVGIVVMVVFSVLIFCSLYF